MQNITKHTVGRSRMPVILAIALLALLIIMDKAFSAPACPMVRYDTQRTGRSGFATTLDPELVWSISSNSLALPVIGRDRTFYYGTSSGFFYARGSDGGLKWQYYAGSAITSPAAVAAEDGSIYFGVSGQFMALYSNGTPKWASAFRFTSNSTPGSPLVDGNGVIYFGADDKYIYAVNPDGTLKWRYLTGGAIRQALAMSPDSSTVYATSADGHIYAVSATDGTMKWKSSIINPTYNAAVGDNGTVYVGSSSGIFYALSSATGASLWTFRTQSKITSAAAIGSDGTIYFGSQDMNMYALDSQGNLKWAYRTGGPIYSAPTITSVVENGIKKSVIVFGAYSGNLLCLNSTDGTKVWALSAGGTIYNSPVVGSDGGIYVLASDGTLSRYWGAVPASPEPSSLIALSGLFAACGIGFFRRRK